MSGSSTIYEKFRPEIPPGRKEWGASGKLDLGRIRKMTSARPLRQPDRIIKKCLKQ